MTNTTELRKKIAEEMGYVSALFMSQECKGTEIVMPSESLISTVDRIMVLIEQAEKAKVEEVIDILKRIACFEIPVTNERDQGFVDALDSAISQIENKFLTKPNDE